MANFFEEGARFPPPPGGAKKMEDPRFAKRIGTHTQTHRLDGTKRSGTKDSGKTPAHELVSSFGSVLLRAENYKPRVAGKFQADAES